MKGRIGRNDPYPCGSGKKFKKCCMKAQSSLPSFFWIEDEGIHFAVPGDTLSPEQLERMTKEYQKQIRTSPLWDEIVREFGKEKAEELLKQCRVKPG